MKSSFVEKIIRKFDRIEKTEFESLLSRLAEERGFLEKILNVLNEGVMVFKADGSAIFTNLAASRIFETRQEKLISSSLEELLPDVDFRELLLKEASINREIELITPTNNSKAKKRLSFYLTAISPEKDVKKRRKDEAKLLKSNFVLLVRDVTEQAKQRFATIESEKLSALSRLAASVAHELGNPLTSLDIHLQILAKKLNANDEDAKKHLQIARGEINRLDNIIRNFLGALRPSQPNFQNVSLQNVIIESANFLHPELKQRKISVKLDIGNDLPLMRVDPDMLKQAIYNLSRNAMQAIGQNGVLKLSCKLKKNSAQIKISDSGGGFAPEILKANRETPGGSQKIGGSGLGLLIARRMLNDNGAELEISSNKKGATARIIFPLTSSVATLNMN